MSQFYGVRSVGPASMAEVAGDANSTFDAFLTSHRGSSAPSYKQIGTEWIDDSVTPWVKKVWDGAQWLTLYSLDATAHLLYPGAGGLRFPATQIASADANVLDDYEKNTFLPGLAFGGASVGMGIAAQTGTYTKIGNTVFIHTLRVALSAKGSSTGAATITGLPFAPVNNGGATVGYYAGMSLTAGPPILLVDGNAAGIRLWQPGTASANALTDANFTATSDLRASFFYRTN